MADWVYVERASRDAADRDAVDREARLTAATGEVFHDNVAQDEELAAKIAANQAIAEANELATENRILETEVRVERERAEANRFGAVLAVCILLAVLVAGAFWLWGRMDRGPTVYADTASGRTVVVQPGR